MKKLIALAALSSLSLFAETKALTQHLTRATVPAQIPGPVAECIMVIVHTDNPAVKSFKVTVQFTNRNGQSEARSQTIERAEGPSLIVSSVAAFYVEGARDVKPAVVEPLTLLTEEHITSY